MKEFLKIWLTLMGLVFGVIGVIAIGVVIITFSLIWGILYFGLVATGVLALTIYHDLHRYD